MRAATSLRAKYLAGTCIPTPSRDAPTTFIDVGWDRLRNGQDNEGLRLRLLLPVDVIGKPTFQTDPPCLTTPHSCVAGVRRMRNSSHALDATV